jgi:hypothetical protein
MNSPKPPIWRRLLRGIVALLQWPLALLILFEEWGWEPLQRVLARIGQWPGFRWIERRIGALSPYAALALFIVPSALLLPIKLLALLLIERGQPLLGTLVILGAKLLGTAVVARLFALTQPALMQLPWFAHGYGRWTVWKEALLAQVRASAPWRLARALRTGVRRRWTVWLRRWRQP